MTNWRTTIVLAVATVSLGAAAPLQNPPAAPDLAGTWTLDTYLSDRPQQVAAAVAADLGVSGPPLYPPAEEGRGGRGGRDNGGRGADGARGSAPSHERSEQRPPLSAEEQRMLDTITTSIRYPPPTLQISQSGGSVTFADPQGQSRSYQTNGKREPQSFETVRAESSARWEGPLLVIDFDLGKGRTITYTYSIVPTSKQLLLRIAFERAPKQPGPFEVKYVYNRSGGQ